MNVGMRPSWMMQVDPNPMTDVLIRDRRGENTNTKDKAGEGTGREWSDAATSHRASGASKSWRMQEKILPRTGTN